jgi:hypothetical protein
MLSNVTGCTFINFCHIKNISSAKYSKKVLAIYPCTEGQWSSGLQRDKLNQLLIYLSR